MGCVRWKPYIKVNQIVIAAVGVDYISYDNRPPSSLFPAFRSIWHRGVIVRMLSPLDDVLELQIALKFSIRVKVVDEVPERDRNLAFSLFRLKRH